MKNDIFFKKIIFTVFIFIFLPVNLNLLAPNIIHAASDSSLVIQPSKTEVSALPGQKIAKSFSVINRSNFNLRLKLTVKDYKQASEDGKLEFYDAKEEQAALWLVPQFLEITLKPLETKEVGFVANVPKDFSGGGHYGAILFEQIGGSGNVVTGNFGELVLLTVTGGINKTNALIKSVNFSTGFMQEGNPVDFNFKMQNSGNTHFEAQSKLVLRDWLGKEIGNYDIGQLIVYPKTARTFKWRWNGTPYVGIYQADVMISSPTLDNKLKSVDRLWFVIFPWKLTLGALVILAAAFVYFKYRKKIILKASKWLGKLQSNGKIKIRIEDMFN